jgi:tRNA modification GTPase
VVVGPVNAGKSSLVNALAGHARSIVSPEPGTTRDLVTTRVVLGGWEVDLVDTAGLRGESDESGPVERAGIARAEAAVIDADLVLRVCPADAGPLPVPTSEEISVVSKIDLAPSARGWPADAVPTSAATGTGIADLVAAIVARLVPEDRTDPDLLQGAVPFTTRQIALIEGLPLLREPALPSSAAMDGGAQTASSERRPRRP